MSKVFGCNKNTIKLRSGRYLDLANPQPDQFEFADIAGGLSKICRFGAQIPRWYSVAEHCLLCADIAVDDGLPLDTQIAVLMHDATEAFLGDVVKPLKIMLPEYTRIESAMEGAIAEKFQIDFGREEASIKQIDHAMLIAEWNAIFGVNGDRWEGEDEARKIEIQPKCFCSEMAEREFTLRAKMLGIRTQEKRP
jgi:hypothetical protein